MTNEFPPGPGFSLDGGLEELSRGFEAQLRSLMQELRDAASRARAEAARDARAAAEADAERRWRDEVARIEADADAHVRAAIERAEADADQRMAAEIARARADAAAQARDEADQLFAAEVSRLRAEADERLAEAVARAHAEAAAEARADADAILARARAEAADMLATEIARVRYEADERMAAEVARVREETDARAAAELDRLRRDTEEHVASERARAYAEAFERARSEASTHAAAEIDRARADAAEQIATEVARARADARRAMEEEARRLQFATTESEVTEARVEEREADLAAFDRLTLAIRRLDDARSLTEILEGLTDSAAAEAARVAVLVVQGPRAQVWRLAGFSGQPAGRGTDVPLGSGGAVATALRTGGPSYAEPGPADRGSGLAFAQIPPDRIGLATPVSVGGRPVALVYADNVSESGRLVPAAWPEAIEILARHAARCLEIVTASRTGQGAGAGATGSPLSRSTVAFSASQEEEARRHARAIVSDLAARHEAAVTTGRQQRDLLERLRPEIDQARRRYEEQVPPAVPARRLYFDQEVLRTLADGDPKLLGY
jgi:chemotaxis protein histidine kinase CheA